MNVSVIGMRLGHVTVHGPDQSCATPQGRGPDDARVGSSAPKPSRRAWFDFNGDGKIDDTNPLYGGDGTVVGVDPAPGAKVREVPDEPPPTPAAMDHARDTYLRYSPTETPETEHTPAPEARVA